MYESFIEPAQHGIPEDPHTNSASRLGIELGCPTAIASLLLSRGIRDQADANAYFAPAFESLHDPLLMRGVEPAVRRILVALRQSEPILIYGDYDVDGTTATALLKKAIEIAAPPDRPAIVTYHVPHRLREGYGMQVNVLSQAAVAGIRLIISVDTGIRAFAAAAEAKAQGIDLIVTDHHLPDPAAGLPEALAVINPSQEGCAYPFKFLCGAAVAFKLAHALLRASTEDAGALARIEGTLVPSFMKLVAIATIADSVPLEGENRAIAALGLRELGQPRQPGLRALFHVAQIPLGKPPTPTQIGFRVAPRMNAAGRMDVAGDVVELLLTRDTSRAVLLAEKLDRLNSDRRGVEATALEAIEQRIAAMRAKDGSIAAKCIVLDDPEWHRGVIGILASRVVNRTARPALIISHEDGEAHGSGRSVTGFHLLDALTAVNLEMGGQNGSGKLDFFSRFGGHAHAAGFTLPSSRVPQLREAMEKYAENLKGEDSAYVRPNYDAELPFGQITPEFFRWLLRLAPFGIGNPEPVFLSKGVVLTAPPRFIHEKHVSLQISATDQAAPQDAMGWSHSIDWCQRCKLLALDQGSRIDILYRVREKSNPRYGLFEIDLMNLQVASRPVA